LFDNLRPLLGQRPNATASHTRVVKVVQERDALYYQSPESAWQTLLSPPPFTDMGGGKENPKDFVKFWGFLFITPWALVFGSPLSRLTFKWANFPPPLPPLKIAGKLAHLNVKRNISLTSA
jgi:hypothetical protein